MLAKKFIKLLELKTVKCKKKGFRVYHFFRHLFEIPLCCCSIRFSEFWRFLHASKIFTHTFLHPTKNFIFSIQCTPLHFASSRGSVDIVKVLLENGADIAAMDRWNVRIYWNYFSAVNLNCFSKLYFCAHKSQKQ